MKKIIVLIVFFAMPAMAAMPIAEKDFAFFAEAITVAGYNCKSSTGGHAMGPAYQGGMLFKVYCNDEALVYRVVTGGKTLCVEPWDGGQRCR